MPDVDYYAILGVTKSVSDAELRAAYRRLVRNAHPDNGGDVDTFQLIQHAYRKLRATRAQAQPAYAAMNHHTRRRPDRWRRMICWSCGVRPASRPLVVVLTKLAAPDQHVDLPFCDTCWSSRVNVRDRRLVSALQTASASSRTGFALLSVALAGLIAMTGYLLFFFSPSDSLVLLFLMWAAIITLLIAGMWPICTLAARMRRDASDFHRRLVDHPPVAALLTQGYRL